MFPDLLLAELSNLFMSPQPKAQEGAELEVRRLQELQREEKRRREEQLEKARLRGMQALRREHLAQVQHPCDLKRRHLFVLLLLRLYLDGPKLGSCLYKEEKNCIKHVENFHTVKLESNRKCF